MRGRLQLSKWFEVRQRSLARCVRQRRSTTNGRNRLVSWPTPGNGPAFRYYLHTERKHNMTRSSRSSAASAGMSLRCSLRCISRAVCSLFLSATRPDAAFSLQCGAVLVVLVVSHLPLFTSETMPCMPGAVTLIENYHLGVGRVCLRPLMPMPLPTTVRRHILSLILILASCPNVLAIAGRLQYWNHVRTCLCRLRQVPSPQNWITGCLSSAGNLLVRHGGLTGLYEVCLVERVSSMA